MYNLPSHSPGFFKNVFNKTARPAFGKLGYYIANYPSKCTGATGLAGDLFFAAQSYQSGNMIGVMAAAIGANAGLILIAFGDPKITEEQKASYVDPQSKLNWYNWVEFNKYPWEYVSRIRMATMMTMLASGVTGQSYGEIIYASLALVGYGIKWIPQQAEGSVHVPEDARGLSRIIYKANAFVQEKPNTVAGGLWNIGVIPYIAEGLIEAQPYKILSGFFYILPNTFTMLSSKRAQVLPAPKNNP